MEKKRRKSSRKGEGKYEEKRANEWKGEEKKKEASVKRASDPFVVVG